MGLPLSNVKSMAELKWLGWILIASGIVFAFFGNWKKNRVKEAIQEDFIVVAISTELTMNKDNNVIVCSLIDSCEPSYWELLNPDGYLACFRYKLPNSRSNAEKLVSNIQKLIMTDDSFASFRVEISEGPVVTEVGWNEKITFPPVGETVNIAFRNKIGRQELHNQKNAPDQKAVR